MAAIFLVVGTLLGYGSFLLRVLADLIDAVASFGHGLSTLLLLFWG